MERLRIKFADALKSVKTLEDIFSEPYSVIVRDATIQRFEYTFEALWKFIKEFLKTQHGIICNSPKSCFRELFNIGYLNDDETVIFLEMTDSRNDTVHTYKEELANIIYEKIKGYLPEIIKILNNFKEGDHV